MLNIGKIIIDDIKLVRAGNPTGIINDNIKEIAHVKNAYVFHLLNFTDFKDSYLPLLSIK